MIRAVRRSPLAVAAVSRGSVWWRLTTLPTQRWLTTPSTIMEDPAQHVRATRATKHREKNARQFALLPSFVEAYKASMGHDVVPKQFAVPPAEDADTYRFPSMPTRMVGRESDLQAIAWPADLLGLHLGRVLRQFATSKKHQMEHPEVTAALVRMEFPLNDAYHKQRWEKQTVAALKTFHRVHGHMNVPRDFVVPREDAEWPVATWGYRLGARVETLRQEAYKLDASRLADLDSVQLPPGKGQATWIDARKGLQEERQRGDEVAVKLGEPPHKEKSQAPLKEKVKVPHKNLAPGESPWGFKVSHEENSHGPPKKKPIELPNEKLSVQDKEETDVALKEKLEATRPKRWDFDDCEHSADNKVDTEIQWSQFVLPSLEVFYRVKGHSLVAVNFVVPSVSPWPTAAWGLKLGACVVRMRSRGDYSTQSKRDATRLSAIDFAWDANEYNWNQRIFPALKFFAEQHGSCDVPRTFVVPSDPLWPRKSWGFALGQCMDEILSRECFFDQTEREAAQLEAIGLVRKPSEYRWSHVILPALETFFSTFHHCDVPSTFVVPSRSPWPEETWGLQLGFCVKSIWSSGAFAAHIERDAARLQAIDFAERSTDYNWNNIVLPALRTFSGMYGHCRVPRTFIVPFKAPWPEKAWGWSLGGAARSIRTSHKYSAQVERDVNELKAIGFHWGGTKDDRANRRVKRRDGKSN